MNGRYPRERERERVYEYGFSRDHPSRHHPSRHKTVKVGQSLPLPIASLYIILFLVIIIFLFSIFSLYHSESPLYPNINILTPTLFLVLYICSSTFPLIIHHFFPFFSNHFIHSFSLSSLHLLGMCKAKAF